MSTNGNRRPKTGGILKNKSQFQPVRKIDHSPRYSDSDDGYDRKEAPDKLEEEFNESFKARQRRRSAGTILPIAAERVKHEVSTKLNIPRSNVKNKMSRQISSEYCKFRHVFMQV